MLMLHFGGLHLIRDVQILKINLGSCTFWTYSTTHNCRVFEKKSFDNNPALPLLGDIVTVHGIQFISETRSWIRSTSFYLSSLSSCHVSLQDICNLFTISRLTTRTPKRYFEMLFSFDTRKNNARVVEHWQDTSYTSEHNHRIQLRFLTAPRLNFPLNWI